MRMNPGRYAVIYNSKYDNNDNIFDSSNDNTVVSISSPSYKPLNYYYYNEYYEGKLEIAKGFLNILLNQSVNKTTVAAVKEMIRYECLVKSNQEWFYTQMQDILWICR